MKITGINKQANSYVLRRFDGVMLVDPGANYEEIISKIKGLKLWGILLTHAHSSHLSLISRFNCPVYLHQEDYMLFTDNKLNGTIDDNQEFDFKKVNLKLISDETLIRFVDKEVEVVYTPGHTKGSVCYYYDNELYTGDTITILGAGFSKRETNSDYQMRKSIQKIYQKFSVNTIVHPGHGKDTTLLEIRQKNSKIRTILKE